MATKYFVRDGQEVFDEDEVIKVEKYSAAEKQAQENLEYTHSLEKSLLEHVK